MHFESVAKSLFITAFLSTAFIVGGLMFVLSNRCIDFSVLENYNPGQPSILLDDQGREWGRFQLERRKFVPLQKIPTNLIYAFLATEDHNFYDHYGLSLRGICRSVFVNLYKGKKAQGASTITQQLVRLLFFDAKKTFTRKLKEQIFALLVEFQFTKDQILETYLNHVYFGHGIYGVQAAAKRFWNKDVQDLTLDQAAVLAGMVRSPLHYSPIACSENAQKRRNIVLRLMQRRGYIDDETCMQAQTIPLQIVQVEADFIAPHLKEMIRVFLEEQVGKQQLYSGGLLIQTTINYDMQKHAQQSFYDHLTNFKKALLPELDGGLVSLATMTGEIKALVGGYDFTKSKFNRVTQAKRQMGSIFKPFVYATALEHGALFTDVETDEPIELKQGNQIWSPQNNTKKFVGQITLAQGLSTSSNIIAVKTLLKVGVHEVMNMARRAHITAELQPYPSIALGCVEANMLQAVGAFNIFANNGVYVQPHYIRWVKDKFGVKIYKTELLKEQVLDTKISGQVLKVLTLGMHRLKKALGNKWFGGDAAGKTGTTNDSRTCWFCGSTPELTTAVYLGEDGNRSLGKKVYGAQIAFPIWFSFYKQVVKEPRYFYYDPSLKEVTVNARTGIASQPGKDPELLSLLIS